MRTRRKTGIAVLLIVSAIGCEGANEVVAPLSPTPAPTRTPTPTTFRIGGTVTSNGRGYSATVQATSGGRQWTTRSSFSGGAYQFVGLPPGEFQVSASASYCGSLTRSVTLPPDAVVDLQLIMCWRDPEDTESRERQANPELPGMPLR